MRAVIYARYSSDNQTEASIEGQIRECMEYATYNDIQVSATTSTVRSRQRQTTAPNFNE